MRRKRVINLEIFFFTFLNFSHRFFIFDEIDSQ